MESKISFHRRHGVRPSPGAARSALNGIQDFLSLPRVWTQTASRHAKGESASAPAADAGSASGVLAIIELLCSQVQMLRFRMHDACVPLSLEQPGLTPVGRAAAN